MSAAAGSAAPAAHRAPARALRLDAQAWATLGLLAALGTLGATGVLPLLGWTERLFPRARLPALFAVVAAGFLGLRRATAPAPRRAIWLAAGLAATALVDVGFAAVVVAWSLAYALVLRARVRARWKHLFLAGTLAAWIIAVNRDLWPGLATHPALERWGLLFALCFTLRALWLHHELRLAGFPRLPISDVLATFLCAPLSPIVPYMLAIPRFGAIREALATRRPALEAQGVRTLALGLAWALLAEAVRRTLSPADHFYGAAHAGRWAEVVPLALLFYPVWQVVRVLGDALLLVGMLRLYGVDIAPAFSAPLLAESVTEWWRRWNTHFRDLLVDLFYYPVVLRLRRHPRLGIVLGCGSVFLLGSTLLHWATRWYFSSGTLRRPPLGLMAENVAMGLVVTGALLLERRRTRPPSTRWLARWRRRFTTWLLVFCCVVGLGYQVTWRTDGGPRAGALGAAAVARTLHGSGRCADARHAAAAAQPSLTAALRRTPRDVALRTELTFVTALAQGELPCP